MYDINYIRNSSELKKEILQGARPSELFERLETLRSREPRIYQVETTNACNMSCRFCPRTDHMDRPVGHMSMEDFHTCLDQFVTHPPQEWSLWEEYVAGAMSETRAHDEDYFYYHICSRALVLHGFGEPLLDNRLVERVAAATRKGVAVYFSANPVNIDLGLMDELGSAGLAFLKFHLDGVDNEAQLYYRGRVDKTYEETRQKINDTIDLFRDRGYPTKVILTKLKFNSDDRPDEEFLSYWGERGVMAYIKNQHNRWLYEEENAVENSAEYMSRFCEFPWSSLSILKDGEVVPCPLEFNGELVLGNIKEQSLRDIWNGERYTELRKMHISGEFPEHHFCTTNCDFYSLHEKIQ